MNPRLKIASPVLEIAVLVALVLIGWEEFRLEFRLHDIVPEMGESRKRLGDLRSEYVQLGEFVQTNANALHGALTNFLRNKSPADLEPFERTVGEGERWLDAQRAEAFAADYAAGQFDFAADDGGTNAPVSGQSEFIALLDRVSRGYSNYVYAARICITNADSSLFSAGLAQNVQAAEAAKARLQDLAAQAAGIGKEMGQFLRDSEEWSQNWSRQLQESFRDRMHRLRFDVFALVGLCFVALVALYGRRMLETRAVIRRHLEEQVKLDKLAHFGRLAQDHVHEIKQPLTAIKARLHTLQKELALGTGAHKDAVIIGGEINRLDQIVKDFLRQARPTEPHPVALTADAAVDTVRDLMASQLEQEGIGLKLEVEPGLKLRADPQQLQQVLINLVKNAAESIDGRGTITLRAKRDTRELKGHSGSVGTLEVQDTGRGIAPEIQERIFDPFFSTKNDGSGLGLAIAARIIDQHGGRLEFETQVGRGTVFRIVLPADEMEPVT